MTEILFNNSPASTIGLEWELALVDKNTYELINAAPDFFKIIDKHFPFLRKKTHRELFENTIELVTDICSNSVEAVADLTETFQIIKKISAQKKLLLYSAGTHPFADVNKQKITSTKRYQDYDERFNWWGRQMQIWGLHVHVGITDKNKIIPLTNLILQYLPHILVVSASSPYLYRELTGFASNRTMLFQQLSTAGLPYCLSDWNEFEVLVTSLRKAGALKNVNELRWDIRPSPELGTLEFRINDSPPTLREIGSVTALIHCLVLYLEQKLANSGDEIPILLPWILKENKWRAARYGIAAEIIVDNYGNTASIKGEIKNLVKSLIPIAKNMNCEADLLRVLDILIQGPSYLRQTRIGEMTSNNLIEVVKSVTRELLD